MKEKREKKENESDKVLKIDIKRERQARVKEGKGKTGKKSSMTTRKC